MTGIITSDMTTTISFVFSNCSMASLPLVALMMWYSRDNESAMTFNKSSLSSTNSSFFLSIFSVISMVSSLFREDITERESDTVSGKGRILLSISSSVNSSSIMGRVTRNVVPSLIWLSTSILP